MKAAGRIRVLALTSAAFLLIGCVGTGPWGDSRSPLSKITADDNTGLEETIAEAERIAAADYPRVREVLDHPEDWKSPRFSIEFRDSLWIPYKGPTSGGTFARRFAYARSGEKPPIVFYQRRVIRLSPELLRDSGRLEQVLRHEMVHLFQDYAPGAPSYWREGIADYTAYVLSGKTGSETVCCGGPSPHYESGYTCAAAFLFHLEANYAPDTVQQLHRHLLVGKYSPDFFEKLTGKTLPDLWTEFQTTERFPPEARLALELRETMTSRGNDQPSISVSIETTLLSQPGGALTLEAIYFVLERNKSGEVIGPKARTGLIILEKEDLNQTETFPANRQVHLLTSDKKERFDYALRKDSPDSPWTIESILPRDNKTGRRLKF